MISWRFAWIDGESQSVARDRLKKIPQTFSLDDFEAKTLVNQQKRGRKRVISENIRFLIKELTN